MKIAVASDHAGVTMKAAVVEQCRVLGHDVVDLGPADATRVDYPDFAQKVALQVAAGTVDRGILVCGSGIGMSMTANRFRGVRAVVAMVALQARLAREHNDANVLCLGERFLGASMAEDVVEHFLSAEFAGGRHRGRVAKIDDVAARSAQ